MHVFTFIAFLPNIVQQIIAPITNTFRDFQRAGSYAENSIFFKERFSMLPLSFEAFSHPVYKL